MKGKSMRYIPFYLFLLSSCSSLNFFSDDTAEQLENGSHESTVDNSRSATPKVSLDQEKPTIPSTSVLDEIELKQAQLWTRIDELESMVQKQKQKIKVLEQGLMLGVVPDEVKKSIEATAKEEVEDKSDKVQVDSISNIDKKDMDQYNKEISEAKMLYHSGKFGKAYLEFAKIEKEYSSLSTNGEEIYWLGRCWAKLREFQSAKKYFETYIREYADSPLAVSAKYHLGTVEMEMGLKEIAVKRFQQIIKEHPYEGTAEAAKQALANFRNNL